MVETVAQVYEQFLAWDNHDLRVRVVIADDFEAVVRSHAHPPGSLKDYVAERLAGRAAAKNLPQNEEGTEVVVVFSDSQWTVSGGAAAAEQVLVVAHELAHPVLNRLYKASGLLDGVIYPSSSPSELSASLSRILWGEYGADTLAGIVLGASSTARPPSEPERPANAWDVWGERQLHGVITTLDDARDNWADLVNEYRNWRMTVSDLWGAILRRFDEATTVLVHAQACADSADVDLMAAAASAGRGPDPLFSDTWPLFASALRQQPSMPTIAELPGVDAAIRDAGDRMFREVLRRLGLSAEDRPNRGAHIHVTEPLI